MAGITAGLSKGEMKLKKIITNKSLSREDLANPFRRVPHRKLLARSGAVDLTDNHWIEYLPKGYIITHPIDPNKKITWTEEDEREFQMKNNIKPVRIQRKRVKGFDLQIESLKRNGLDCAYVGRPGRFGNPFIVGKSAVTAETAIEAYRSLLRQNLKNYPNFLEPLRGKNLACWCREDAGFCHADVILEFLAGSN